MLDADMIQRSVRSGMMSQSRLDSPYHKEAFEWIPASPFTSSSRDTARGVCPGAIS